MRFQPHASRRIEGATWAAVGRARRSGFSTRKAKLPVHALDDVRIVWTVFGPEAGDAGEVAAEIRGWRLDHAAAAEVVVPWVGGSATVVESGWSGRRWRWLLRRSHRRFGGDGARLG